MHIYGKQNHIYLYIYTHNVYIYIYIFFLYVHPFCVLWAAHTFCAGSWNSLLSLGCSHPMLVGALKSEVDSPSGIWSGFPLNNHLFSFSEIAVWLCIFHFLLSPTFMEVYCHINIDSAVCPLLLLVVPFRTSTIRKESCNPVAERKALKRPSVLHGSISGGAQCVCMYVSHLSLLWSSLTSGLFSPPSALLD